MAFRCQEIATRPHFVALEQSEGGWQETAKQGFGIDAAKGCADNHELAKTVTACKTAHVYTEVKVHVDAVSKARTHVRR